MYPKNDGVEDTEHLLVYYHSHHLQGNYLRNHVRTTLLSYGMLNLPNEEIGSVNLDGDVRLPFESIKAIIKPTLDIE